MSQEVTFWEETSDFVFYKLQAFSWYRGKFLVIRMHPKHDMQTIAIDDLGRVSSCFVMQLHTASLCKHS